MGDQLLIVAMTVLVPQKNYYNYYVIGKRIDAVPAKVKNFLKGLGGALNTFYPYSETQRISQHQGALVRNLNNVCEKAISELSLMPQRTANVGLPKLRK